MTSNEGRGGRTYKPRVFTEHGALMASTVLRSKEAVAMSVYLIEAFVKIREEMTSKALKRFQNPEEFTQLFGVFYARFRFYAAVQVHTLCPGCGNRAEHVLRI